MRFSSQIKKKLDSIDLKRFSLYLKANDWIIDGKISNMALIWHRKEEEYSNYEILMPIKKNLADYYDRLFDAVQVLANFYKKDLINVVNDIIGYYTDNIKIQLKNDDVENGTIQFNDGLNLIDNAQEMMNAAALSTITKKKSFSGNKPNEVLDFVNSLRLGQTEVGSYIINVIAPLKFIEEKTLFGEQNISYERKVIKNLSRGLKSLKRAAMKYKEANDFIVFLEQINNGVSSNLCKAVAELSGEEKNKDINIKIEYFNSIDKSKKIDEYDFEPNEVKIIDKAASYLNEEFWFEEYVIQGFVTRLSRDEKEEKGKITLDCFVEEKSRKVTVVLNSQQYEKAILAHKNHNMLECVGELHMKPRYSLMEDVISIEIIEINNENNRLF